MDLSQVGPNAFDTDTMIVNSTISGNKAERHTVRLTAETGAVLNSTIVFNEHRGGTDGSRCTDYAAVLLDGGWEGPMQLESTIVTNNACVGNPYYDNGGPTRTHALLADSPAIDAGNNVAGLEYDQRGPGYLRVKRLRAEIGAYER